MLKSVDSVVVGLLTVIGATRLYFPLPIYTDEGDPDFKLIIQFCSMEACKVCE